MIMIPDYVSGAIARSIHEARISVIDNITKMLSEKMPDRADEISSYLNVYRTTLANALKSTAGSTSTGSVSGRSDRKRRAQTAYNQYIGRKIVELKETMKGVSSKEIMKVAMNAWKNMSEEEKRALKDEFIRTRSGSMSVSSDDS